MSATNGKSTALSHNRALRRAHYTANLDEERRKLRERVRRQRNNETVETREYRLARHREAQARYRENNRLTLRIKSWQKRKEKTFLQARKADEAEFQLQMLADV